MKIHYTHDMGATNLSAPSGTTYQFEKDGQGRRVAEVDDPDDAEWFLSQRDVAGKKRLFESLDAGRGSEPAVDPNRRRARSTAIEMKPEPRNQ